MMKRCPSQKYTTLEMEEAKQSTLGTGGLTMASCNECLHKEACNHWLQKDNKHLGAVEGFICEHFKDRSKFVELPCKAGDIIYEICERRKSGEWKKIVVERVVHSIDVGIGGSMVARCGTTISVFLSGIGKTVFLTRESVEKALEDQKNDCL